MSPSIRLDLRRPSFRLDLRWPSFRNPAALGEEAVDSRLLAVLFCQDAVVGDHHMLRLHTGTFGLLLASRCAHLFKACVGSAVRSVASCEWLVFSGWCAREGELRVNSLVFSAHDWSKINLFPPKKLICYIRPDLLLFMP